MYSEDIHGIEIQWNATEQKEKKKKKSGIKYKTFQWTISDL